MKLRFLTAGESHGRALVGILEGVPSGLRLTAEDIHRELRRRKLGYGRGARQKMEDDSVQILSGVRHGLTLGSPIALMIENKDWRNWTDVMQPEPPASVDAGTAAPGTSGVRRRLEVPRPGHADYVGGIKYGHEDMRNVLERASARETTIRVAIAAVARQLLSPLRIGLASRVTRIGDIEDLSPLPADLTSVNLKADSFQLRVLDASIDAQMVEHVGEMKKKGDTLGGEFEVLAWGLPLGLGSYVQWDRRIEAEIGRAFLSLNAIKGVEIGLGFRLAATPGSQAHDELYPASGKSGATARVEYRTNRSGGVDGGMTTGQPLVVRAAMKPLSTLMDALDSVKLSTGEVAKAHVERSDVCAVPAAAVIGESLLALVLADAVLDKFGGDSMQELADRVADWRHK